MKDLTLLTQEQEDDGRFEVTGNPGDRHAYKTPSLRNVALSPPYMHDGSLATLAEVIDFYAGGSGCDRREKVELSSQERRQLLAFLGSLTSATAADLGRDARAAFVNY